MHPLLAKVDALMAGEVPSSSETSYRPRHTKIISAEDASLDVVLLNGGDSGRVSVVRGEWAPQRYVFGDASDAQTKARKCRGVVRENGGVLHVQDAQDTLFSPADIHEALMSCEVTQVLGHLPFFPAHLQGVRLPAARGDAKLYFRELTALPLEDLAVASEGGCEEPLLVHLAFLAVALAAAQQRLGLKHMDCHSGNVMWVAPPSHLAHCIVPNLWGPGRHLCLPFGEHIPAVIDFGLSTACWAHEAREFSLRRIDYHLLETDENEEDWGLYSPELQGDEGYDLATFLESATRDLSDLRPQPLRCLKTLQEAQAVLGISEWSTEGRPSARVPMSMLAFLRATGRAWEVSTYHADTALVLHLVPTHNAEQAESQASQGASAASGAPAALSTAME